MELRESTIDIQRDAVFESLHGVHSTHFCRTYSCPNSWRYVSIVTNVCTGPSL